MVWDGQSSYPMKKRRILQAGGMGGLVFLTAGCLGDDEQDDEDDSGDDIDLDDTDDELMDDGDDEVVQDDDTDDEADPADDGEPDAEPVEIHDVTLHYAHPDYDHPPDMGHNPYSPELPFPHIFDSAQAPLVQQQDGVDRMHPVLASDWSYEPGILEFTLRDGYYWWSGDEVTIDDVVAVLEFEDYFFGGDELNAHENIITYEKTGDRQARLALADTWREFYALVQTLAGWYPPDSRFHLEPWIEAFEDAPDLDAIHEIREDIEATPYTTDEDIEYAYYHGYEFRLDDDGPGGIGETYFEFEAVPEKDGNLRHTFNPETNPRPPNYRYIRAHVSDTAWWEVGGTDWFLNGDFPWIRPDTGIEEDADFPIREVHLGPGGGTGFTFNSQVHPGDNVHFRRAWGWFVDVTAWMTEPVTSVYPSYLYPLSNDDQLNAWVSEEIIDSLTDYGIQEHRWDDAETEMETGGFERNADGEWLLQEDGPKGDAGEAIDLTIDTWGWADGLQDHATDFWSDLEDWGIETEIIPDTDVAWGLREDYVVRESYTGAEYPELAFEAPFGSPAGSRGFAQLPSTVEAPELGATTGPGPDTADWVEFNVGPMYDRLPVTTDQEMYQSLIDQLTWVSNQIVPHFTVSTGNLYWVNDHHWSYVDPDETPELFWGLIRFMDGQWNWVPEADR